MKKVLLFIVYLILCMLGVPAAITAMARDREAPASAAISGHDGISEEVSPENIRYLDSATGTTQQIAFEEYIKGVVAAEMPALFEMEALKAQAVAARTYALRHVDFSIVHGDLNGLGQAYLPPETLMERWGDNFAAYFNKISRAVDSTNGQILVYEGEPIEAVFHSTSAGVTESSGAVWQVALPYLVSVDSSFDADAPGFMEERTFTGGELLELLNLGDGTLTAEEIVQQISIDAYTQAGYVKNVSVGDVLLEGASVRAMLGLKSTNFTIEKSGDNVTFTTKGYGHGAGMSQYGANFLAREGHSYTDILRHYYRGVAIASLAD